MAWENRDYNRGGGGGDDYLSNPAGLLGLSVPFGTWLGVRVRLHFWLLLSIAFGVIDLLHGASLPSILAGIALLIGVLLLHEFGHRVAAKSVGGAHDEFMLWPAGGLIFPRLPGGPFALFIGHAGGMIANFVAFLIGWFGVRAMTGAWARFPFNPLRALGAGGVIPISISGDLRSTLLFFLLAWTLLNWAVALLNLLPYYWFDGGSLWQAVLWPLLGAYQAINIVCWAGMILAVPMFFLGLAQHNFLGMILWALLFSGAYTRRKQLRAEGTNELESAIAYSAQDVGVTAPKRRKWLRPGWAQSAVREARREREEQATIDAILAKVSAQGMQSLTSKEKRTLQKATERQRRSGR